MNSGLSELGVDGLGEQWKVKTSFVHLHLKPSPNRFILQILPLTISTNDLTNENLI